jgi:hypothetical protein
MKLSKKHLLLNKLTIVIKLLILVGLVMPQPAIAKYKFFLRGLLHLRILVQRD